MTSSLHSSLEDINSALQNQNPFSQPPFVNANNVWGKNFADVETLNAHASDAVFQALEQIRAGHYSTTSILITAQNGTGKTHIISRIRHRLQVQGGALLFLQTSTEISTRLKADFNKF
jgi:DNA replication protein DnaC